MNPISIILISIGRFSSWTIFAHHILHGGYDKNPSAPERYTRKGYLKGHWRLLNWFDWILPQGWTIEHNYWHHYHLGEMEDPDQPEENFKMFRTLPISKYLKILIFFIMSLVWKPLYYAVITTKILQTKNKPPFRFGIEFFTNFHKHKNYQVLTKSWIPYCLFTFVLIPLFYLPLGSSMFWAALKISLLAELLTNFHSFICIVPNHVGSDVVRFSGRAHDKKEFYLRQILGSVNYKTGGDLRDFMHGFLNYQIEHHLWPDLSLLQYQRLQPEVKKLCEAYGVPYRQESILKRVRSMTQVFTGESTMPTM